MRLRVANPSQETIRMRLYRERHLEKFRTYQRDYMRRVRLIVIEHYGNRCACCQEGRTPFLSIDHMNGGGTRHRREVRHLGSNFFIWLRKNGYPSGYRVLCFNCNLAYGFYGYCPHTTGGSA